MPFGEARGRLKCSKRIIGIVAFVHTGITLKPSNALCVTLEKVTIPVLNSFFTKKSFFNFLSVVCTWMGSLKSFF